MACIAGFKSSDWFILTFDITNSTAFDQFFVYGREIFCSIARVVDQIFNNLVRREGFREPYFTSYCNGTTSTCRGMSQWGSQELALRGFAPLAILRNYYPRDVNIFESNNFVDQTATYPGSPLSLGSRGEAVQRLQVMLNRITGNWWIPNVGRPDGVFGPATRESVIAFQRLFNLTPDGIVGRATWNNIVRIFVAAAELSELTSEGERIGVGEAPPDVIIRQGARGEHVALLQFIINYISEFYPEIPFVVGDSRFGPATENAVRAFQKMVGITQDGVVGPVTWRRLYDTFNSINNTVRPPTTNPVYPGTPLRQGTVSNDVAIMQRLLNVIGQHFPQIGSLRADGIFGPITNAAVVAFQNQFGLAPDGVIGPLTWARIVEVYNEINSGGGVAPPPGPPTPPQPPSPPLPPTPPPFPGLIRQGDRGENVLYIQKLLNSVRLIYPSIPALAEDGIFGPITRSAVVAFQRIFGLSPDGIVGPITWGALTGAYQNLPPSNTAPTFPGYNIRRGFSSNNVRTMQNLLRAAASVDSSIPMITADGIFGPLTEGAVRAFQNRFGLNPDGIVGPLTWNMLVSVSNRAQFGQPSQVAAQAALPYMTTMSSFDQPVGRTRNLAALYALSRLGI